MDEKLSESVICGLARTYIEAWRPRNIYHAILRQLVLAAIAQYCGGVK